MRIVQLKIILAFHVNAKLPNININIPENLKTVSGKYRMNMVTWSFLPFAVSVILISSLSQVIEMNLPLSFWLDDHLCGSC